MRDFKPEIKWVSIDSVYPYTRNAKQHPKEQIDKIANQIDKVGWTQPIVIDAAEVIIAGHGRYQAAHSLGLKEVPVIVADHLTDEETMAYRIADNKVSESTWDLPMLAFDIGTLEREGIDLILTGFNLDEAQNILSDFKGAALPSDSKDYKDPEEKEKQFEHQCPKCGFEFD